MNIATLKMKKMRKDERKKGWIKMVGEHWTDIVVNNNNRLGIL